MNFCFSGNFLIRYFTSLSYILFFSWCKKNPTYKRHQLSRLMRIVGPIQFWRSCKIYNYFLGGGLEQIMGSHGQYGQKLTKIVKNSHQLFYWSIGSKTVKNSQYRQKQLKTDKKNGQEWSKTANNGQYCQKRSETVKNDQIQSKRVNKGQIW